ncbi:Hypothetical protein POVR2_LOCUS193 [uncultured virus]|nr:Hypothetical protein POVR2_LOCUS193 [uncultured virus]
MSRVNVQADGSLFFCSADELAVRILLFIGRNPGACNNRALRRACEAGYTETVRLLLADPRVNPSVANNECLRRVPMDKKYNETLYLLLTDPRTYLESEDLQSFIRTAVIYNNIERIKMLLADPRASSYVPSQNVMIDAKSDEVVRLLLRQDEDQIRTFYELRDQDISLFRAHEAAILASRQMQDSRRYFLAVAGSTGPIA